MNCYKVIVSDCEKNHVKTYYIIRKDRTEAFEEVRKKFSEEFKANPWLHYFDVQPVGNEKQD